MVRKPSTFLVLGLSVVVFLAGCAKEPESTTTTPTPTATTGGEPKGTEPKTEGNQTEPPKGNMAAVDFAKDVAPTLQKYCQPCHSGPAPKKGLDVTKLTGTEKAVLAKMAAEVEMGKMPPPKATPVPDDAKPKLVADLKALGS